MKEKSNLFSTENQPPEKWTEEKAIALGEELIQWMQGDGNLTFRMFLVNEKKLNKDTLTYLKKKFESFSYFYDLAFDMQKNKLIDCGLKKETDANFTKFILGTHHGLYEKKEADKEEEKTYTLEELRKLKQQLEDEF